MIPIKLFGIALIFMLPQPVMSFQDSPRWKRFAPPEAKFAVLMPGTPAAQTDVEESPRGKIISHSYSLVIDNGVLEVLYVDNPLLEDVESELKAQRDTFLKDVRGILRSEKRIEYQGHPGIEFKCKSKSQIFLTRVYVVGKTVYELVGAAREDRVDYEFINRFLDSFDLISN